MLDQFLACPANHTDADRSAFQFAWRPVGARPLSAALTQPPTPRLPITRPALPSFELLSGV